MAPKRINSLGFLTWNLRIDTDNKNNIGESLANISLDVLDALDTLDLEAVEGFASLNSPAMAEDSDIAVESIGEISEQQSILFVEDTDILSDYDMVENI